MNCKSCGGKLRADNKYGYCNRNRECINAGKRHKLTLEGVGDQVREKNRRWRENNPDKVRDFKLKDCYGISLEQYHEMLDSQGGGCAACGKKFTTYSDFAVDHDHSCCPSYRATCGKCVRAILCKECNQALGMLEEDPDRIMGLAAYALSIKDKQTTLEGNHDLYYAHPSSAQPEWN